MSSPQANITRSKRSTSDRMRHGSLLEAAVDHAVGAQSNSLVVARLVLPREAANDAVVQWLLRAEKALQCATTIERVKLVVDIAEAQRIFATRQRLGADLICSAHALRVRALVRLGELLSSFQKAKGAQGAPGPGRGKRGIQQAPRFRPPTYDELGLTKKTAAAAQQLAALPPETLEALARRETTLSKVRRAQQVARVRTASELPCAKYRVFYADPPWPYNDKADDPLRGGGAGRHYPSMTIAELCAMPIRDRSEDNAVLFCWVTCPLLPDSLSVIAAWGFAYKTNFVWDKVKHNMGHYSSVRHELLLVCTRGSCTPDIPKLFDSVQSIERTTHSSKPEQFRNIISALYPHGRRIELFARGVSPAGWDSWGNEAEALAAAGVQ